MNREVLQRLRDAEYERTRHGWRCPECHAPMYERTNRRKGSLFFGCSRYPKCFGTRDEFGYVDPLRDTWENREAGVDWDVAEDMYPDPRDYGYEGDG